MAEDATPLHPDLRKDNVIVHSHMTMGDRDFTYEDGLAKARSGYGPEEIISLEKEYDTSEFPVRYVLRRMLQAPKLPFLRNADHRTVPYHQAAAE